MTMSDSDMLQRLERLKAKQERGEELTDEEVQQLQEDLESFENAMSGFVESFAAVYTDALSDFHDALQPLVECCEVESDE